MALGSQIADAVEDRVVKRLEVLLPPLLETPAPAVAPAKPTETTEVSCPAHLLAKNIRNKTVLVL
jgi:hypothetical protein